MGLERMRLIKIRLEAGPPQSGAVLRASPKSRPGKILAEMGRLFARRWIASKGLWPPGVASTWSATCLFAHAGRVAYTRPCPAREPDGCLPCLLLPALAAAAKLKTAPRGRPLSLSLVRSLARPPVHRPESRNSEFSLVAGAPRDVTRSTQCRERPFCTPLTGRVRELIRFFHFLRTAAFARVKNARLERARKLVSKSNYTLGLLFYCDLVSGTVSFENLLGTCIWLLCRGKLFHIKRSQ